MALMEKTIKVEMSSNSSCSEEINVSVSSPAPISQPCSGESQVLNLGEKENLPPSNPLQRSLTDEILYEESVIPGRPLPHLLTPIEISRSIKAHEMINQCRNILQSRAKQANLGLKSAYPPDRPVVIEEALAAEPRSPAAPVISIENEEEARSHGLVSFCIDPRNPLAIIKGLIPAVGFGLELFTTKCVMEQFPECRVEVRKQLQQPSDENWDSSLSKKIWQCESSRSFTSITKYAQYQAETFENALIEAKEEKTPSSECSDDDLPWELVPPSISRYSYKFIKFGTNLDLSDAEKWEPQLKEIEKLPWLFRVASDGNMLNEIGHDVLGVNTVQMYLKVPGSRTPGHQENNNLSAVNINIGPGNTEWFAVEEKYWGMIDALCQKNGIEYLSGSWWPVLEDLYESKIPIYRFIQKPGDLVWLNAGTVHWVQAVGWCNNIAWNVGPISAYQYQLTVERYEWNKWARYKSIVPVLQLTWNMAKNVQSGDKKLWPLMKTCMMRSLWECENILDDVKKLNKVVHWRGRHRDEPAHYCESCEEEVFNILFVRRAPDQITHHVYCYYCARRQSSALHRFVVLHQYHMDALFKIYDEFKTGTTAIEQS